MCVVARSRQVVSQEPGTPWAEAHMHGPLSAVFPHILARNWIRRRAARTSL